MDKNDRQIIILMADDDADDRSMVKDALEETGIISDLFFAEDGEELMDYLYHHGKYVDPARSPRPALILLDLNMPKKDGREALKEIKKQQDLRQIPIVVLTTSKAEEDIHRTYDLGVNSFITKPASFDELVHAMKVLLQYWFATVKLPVHGTECR